MALCQSVMVSSACKAKSKHMGFYNYCSLETPLTRVASLKLCSAAIALVGLGSWEQ